MGDDGFDPLAFADELPSLFAADGDEVESDNLLQQQQQLEASYTESTELTAATSSLDFLQAPSTTEALSAEEVAEILRGIEDEDDDRDHEGEYQQEGALVQKQQLLQQLGGSGGKLTKKKKYANKNPNKARDGRKEELVYLRKTVLELETKLSALREKNRNNRVAMLTEGNRLDASATSLVAAQGQQGKHSSGKQPSRSRKSQRSLVAQGRVSDLKDVWREIARHQCDERDRSERENIHLRLVLENQLKVAKSLEKFLMLKAASTMEIGKSINMDRNHRFIHAKLSDDQREAAIFHDLLIGVEKTIAEVDAVYEANGLMRIETTQMNARTRFEPAGGMFVEVCATKVLPFGIHETGEAVWNHITFAKQRMPSRSYSYRSLKSVDATEDTVVEDFSLEVLVKNTRASFRVRQVTRRVIEEERVVIAWHTFSDPVEYAEQQLSGLRSFEKGYIVIRKSPSSAPGTCVTLLQPCHVVSPASLLEGAGILEADDSVVGAITDFTLSATADFVAGTHQMVENVLLEQALKRGSSSIRSS